MQTAKTFQHLQNRPPALAMGSGRNHGPLVSARAGKGQPWSYSGHIWPSACI